MSELLRTSYLRLAADVRALLRPGGVVRVEVGPPGPVDLRLVGELARLQLLARRCGARLSVHDAGGRLDELVSLAGLTSLAGPPLPPETQPPAEPVTLAGRPPAGSRLGGQVHGQAEAREQLGPDEVVDVGDAPA